MSTLPRIFSALSDPTRLAIVDRLMNEGELPVARLREGFAMTAPAMSHHLNVLLHAGVVQRRADKQRRIYSVRPQAIETVGAWTISHRDFWEASLSRLDTALTREMNRK